VNALRIENTPQPHRTLFAEAPKTAFVFPNYYRKRPMQRAVAAWASRATDVVWNVAELDRGNRATSGH
jgi:hypothetical protein